MECNAQKSISAKNKTNVFLGLGSVDVDVEFDLGFLVHKSPKAKL